MNIVDRALRNWKLHVLALILTVIAELIGTHSFKLGPASLVMIPLLYSFILGALCGLPMLKLLSREDMFETSSLVGVTFFFLMARYGTLVGPSFWKVVHSAPALILQEFGNIGTVFFGIPIAVMLGLRREAVGAAFSNAREPNIAIIGEKYGMDTPEGVRREDGRFYKFLSILDDEHRREEGPVDPACDCVLCRSHSRAYLHHLFKVNDPYALRLATAHNLRFYGRLMELLDDE